MLKKLSRKARIAPETDDYVSKRYEDTAVTIHFNIQQGRTIYSAYVPWFQSMLIKYIPLNEIREKYWLDQVPLYYSSSTDIKSAWMKHDNQLEADVDQHEESVITVTEINNSVVEIAKHERTVYGRRPLEELLPQQLPTDDINRISGSTSSSKFCIIL